MNNVGEDVMNEVGICFDCGKAVVIKNHKCVGKKLRKGKAMCQCAKCWMCGQKNGIYKFKGLCCRCYKARIRFEAVMEGEE